MKRWHHGHSLATGAMVGLLVSYRPWLILAAGILLGAGLTFALPRTVRAAGRMWDALEHRIRPAKVLEAGGGRGAALAYAAEMVRRSEEDPGMRAPIPGPTLSDVEREKERLAGLRQAEAAAIRAQTRRDYRERFRREQMLASGERFGAELRQRSLRRAGA